MMHHTLNEKFSYFFASVCVGLIGFLPVSGEAQTVIGGNTPDPSAMLDIQSTSKGVLFPRVPNNSSVPSPATGLIIWNDDTGCLEINLGTPANPSWQSITCAPVRCGAYLAPNVWKDFMCNNLGSVNPDSDPFTPSWENNGNYWQWGRLLAAATGPTSTDGGITILPNNAAPATWISSLDGGSTAAPDDAWRDDIKTANDPCPEGFRVPANEQWFGILDNATLNPISDAPNSSWTSSASNYATGKKFGESLMLPAAGSRNRRDGVLENRGLEGGYLSSTWVSSDAWVLIINSSGATRTTGRRHTGFSIRCIATE